MVNSLESGKYSYKLSTETVEGGVCKRAVNIVNMKTVFVPLR